MFYSTNEKKSIHNDYKKSYKQFLNRSILNAPWRPRKSIVTKELEKMSSLR